MPIGALVQLVAATSEQDLYIIGDPQITFFKTVYRRHTNFSIETRKEVFINDTIFGKTTVCNIPKIGDLVSNLTLYIKLGTLNPVYDSLLKQATDVVHQEFNNIIDDDGNINENICACTTCIEEQYTDELLFSWVNSIGHALVKSAWISIGGRIIDKQYGEWMEIWSELTQTQEKRDGYYQMIGKVDPTSFTSTTFTSGMELYIPLNFWFCKNIGLALPLMSLYHSEIQIGVNFRSFKECWVKNKSGSETPTIPSFNAVLLIDYIYLSLEERKKFYEESQIYLIEQIQTTEPYSISNTITPIDLITFSNPIKEFIWVLQRDDVTGTPTGVFSNTNYPIGNDWFNYSMFACRTTSRIQDTFGEAVLQCNGIDRFEQMPASYFRLLQPYFKHTRNPINYIYTYSFALKPEEHQPTGHMNLSKIDSCELKIYMNNIQSKFDVKYQARVYAINYNILVITKGVGSILFA